MNRNWQRFEGLMIFHFLCPLPFQLPFYYPRLEHRRRDIYGWPDTRYKHLSYYPELFQAEVVAEPIPSQFACPEKLTISRASLLPPRRSFDVSPPAATSWLWAGHGRANSRAQSTGIVIGVELKLQIKKPSGNCAIIFVTVTNFLRSERATNTRNLRHSA